MRKKLLFSVFSLFFLLFSFFQFYTPPRAVAAQQTQTLKCGGENLTLTYNDPLVTDTSMEISLTKAGLPGSGWTIVILGPDDPDYTADGFVRGNPYKTDLPITNKTVTTKTGVLGSTDPNNLNKSIHFFLFPASAESLPGDVYYFDERSCDTIIDLKDNPDEPPGGPGGENTCTIQLNYPRIWNPPTKTYITLNHFTPDDGISFRVNGLQDPNNSSIIRGYVLINKSQNNAEKSSQCVSNPILSDQDHWVSIKTEYGNKLPTGNYKLNINDSCTFWGNPQAPVICSTDFKVCITSSDKDCKEAGSSCNPNNPQCPTEAPYCLRKDIKDPKSPFVCKKNLPTINEKCSGGSCITAIGNFGYQPKNFAQSVLRLFLAIGGGILLLFLILNGYRLMTSQGDPEKVKEARESIISAIAGLLLIIFSLVILQFITVDILGLPGFNK